MVEDSSPDRMRGRDERVDCHPCAKYCLGHGKDISARTSILANLRACASNFAPIACEARVAVVLPSPLAPDSQEKIAYTSKNAKEKEHR